VASRRLVFRIPLALLALLLGVGVVVQFRAQRRVRAVSSDREAQALLLSELVGANDDLRAEIAALESQLAVYGTDRRAVGLQELVDELNRIKTLNGLVEVSGPGIELEIDGALSALDLQDLVNELRNAGAEAISLNGYRLVVSSAPATGNEGQLVVDGQVVTRPFSFQAIGDPKTLESALLRPGGLLLLQQRSYPNMAVTVRQQTHLVLAVHPPQTAFQYAQRRE
jgi:uncharacterized protein YlxW (UPF0749 family)